MLVGPNSLLKIKEINVKQDLFESGQLCFRGLYLGAADVEPDAGR